MRKVTEHIKKNYGYYLAGTGLLLSGVVVGVLISKRAEASVEVSPKGVFINSPVTTEVHLERRGHPGYVIQCNETGEIFASQNRAAEALGIKPARIREYLLGHRDHVNGLTFTNLGEAK